MTMKWYGDAFSVKLDKEIDKRIKRAVILIASHAKDKLGREQPTEGTGTKKRGLNPSKPGEYPKKVLGHLRRSVMAEYDPRIQTGRVGVGKDAEYGKWLELGTRKMKRRPWLSMAVAETASRVRNILKAKI